MAFQLTSTAFKAGEHIPRRYTCDGDDRSPPLAWSGAPVGTKSFVLLCDDPDAPAGTWHHWALFDIPSRLVHLDEGYSSHQRAVQARQAVNDFGDVGYGGPCPPPGHGVHHYHFKLLALDVDKLKLSERSRCTEVDRAAKAHVLATAELIGLYSR
jgi:Raf kinase inhibitor-like YbhB/YbcL family protein